MAEHGKRFQSGAKTRVRLSANRVVKMQYRETPGVSCRIRRWRNDGVSHCDAVSSLFRRCRVTGRGFPPRMHAVAATGLGSAIAVSDVCRTGQPRVPTDGSRPTDDAVSHCRNVGHSSPISLPSGAFDADARRPQPLDDGTGHARMSCELSIICRQLAVAPLGTVQK